MHRAIPAHYERKFADFIRMCAEAHASGIKPIVVPTLATIGGGYPEIIESLSPSRGGGLDLGYRRPGAAPQRRFLQLTNRYV